MLTSRDVGGASVSAITESTPNRRWNCAWGICDFFRDAPEGLPVSLQTQQAAAGTPGTDDPGTSVMTRTSKQIIC